MQCGCCCMPSAVVVTDSTLPSSLCNVPQIYKTNSRDPNRLQGIKYRSPPKRQSLYLFFIHVRMFGRRIRASSHFCLNLHQQSKFTNSVNSHEYDLIRIELCYLKMNSSKIFNRLLYGTVVKHTGYYLSASLQRLYSVLALAVP